MSDRARPAIGLVIVVALAMAALVPVTRPLVLLFLLVGLLVTSRAGSALWRWGFAAALPVALIFSWNWLIGDRLVADDLVCADVGSSLAWLRIFEAVLVIAAIVLLARVLGTSLQALGLGRPTRPELAVGVVAVLLIPLPSLYVGVILAEPFFGPMDLDLSQPAALVPALLLAVANGTMEELAYRGALMAWLSRAAGPTAGLLGQAFVFGFAHTGPDFVGPALPVVLAIVAAGLLAGLIARRTGSLWLVIAVHIAFDVPLYFAAACRLSGG